MNKHNNYRGGHTGVTNFSYIIKDAFLCIGTFLNLSFVIKCSSVM